MPAPDSIDYTSRAAARLAEQGGRKVPLAAASSGGQRRRIRRTGERRMDRLLKSLIGSSHRPPAAKGPAVTADQRRQQQYLRRRGDVARRRSALRRVNKVIAAFAADESHRFPGTDKHGLTEIPFTGRAGYIESPPQVQATSHQIAGLYPFLTASPRPTLGAPMGVHYVHRHGIFLDLMTLYLSGGASSPSMFIFGLQGRGKSSFLLRMCVGMLAAGFLLVVPGDLKGEYSKLIRFVGGEVIEIGPNADCISPLDAGPVESYIEQITDPKVKDDLLAEMRMRRHLTSRSLVEMVLNRDLDTGTGEAGIFAEAVDRAVAEKGSQGYLGDVLRHLHNVDDAFLESTMVQTQAEFMALARPLVYALRELVYSPDFGGTFSRPTSRPMPVGTNVSFDISAVPVSQARYRAALQIVTWSYSQAVTSSVKSLQEAQIWPETHYVMLFDELWQAFQVAPRVAVYMLEEILRVSRTKGIGSALATHGTGDLKMPDEDLTARAKKFVARSSMRVYAGIDPEEINDLEGVQKFTSTEKQWLSEWAADGGYGAVPPGRGKFLIKTGDGPGLPLDMLAKTPFEYSLHDTDTAFAGARAAVTGFKAVFASARKIITS